MTPTDSAQPISANSDLDGLTDAPPRDSVPPDLSPAGSDYSTIAWLTPGDRLIILLIATMVIAVSAGQWAIDRWYYGPKIPVSRMPESTYRYRIDVNSADWIELSQLEAVGPTLAKRIVTRREEVGPYKTVDELLRVKGIGKKTLNKFREFVIVGSEPAPQKNEPAAAASPVK